MESKLNQQAVQQLYQMVLSLKTQEECAKFFEDLCTVQELKALSQRLHVARMLDQNRVYSDIVQQTGASTATIGLLNAFSAVAGKVMTLAGISSFLSNLITENIASKAGFLLMINILFLFMGTFMDINATILIMTPLLLPVAQTYGISAVHFGAIMIVNMCVGFLTPPFAVGIFVSTKIAHSTFGDTLKEAVPFMGVGLIAIIITTLCPGYVDFFVHLFA